MFFTTLFIIDSIAITIDNNLVFLFNKLCKIPVLACTMHTMIQFYKVEDMLPNILYLMIVLLQLEKLHKVNRKLQTLGNLVNINNLAVILSTTQQTSPIHI